MDKITPEMTISDVIKKYPSTVDVMLANGIHCVGCHVSYFETIGDGLAGHGFTQEKIDSIMKELNQSAEQSGEVVEGKIITITQKAAEKLKEILVEDGKPTAGLRVQVVPGGCEGNQYALEVDDKSQPKDTVVEEFGVKVFIDEESMPLIRGSKIDFVDAMQGGGFRISNVNAKSTCGCGQSFN